MASSGTKCCITWCWIIQVLLWISMIFLICGIIIGKDLLGASLGTFSGLYVIYVISNLCSPNLSYLCNKHGSNSIHTYMKQLFYTPPSIVWHIECYHYETTYHTVTDSNGNTTTETRSHKVTTFSMSREFNYYTWRDTSGLFLLDSHKIFQSEKKKYIKLELSLDIDFADPITQYDYQVQKDEFYNSNRWRDTHANFTESFNVRGLNKYNMVRISEDKTAGVNCCWLLIFTFFLPVAELYKMYVDSLCIEQDYKIKKIVSSRYNLQEQEHSVRWEKVIPTLVIFNNPQIVFNEAPTPIHNNPILPSMEELEQAKNMKPLNTHSNEGYTPYFSKESPNQGNIMTNLQQPSQMEVQGGMMTNYQ